MLTVMLDAMGIGLLIPVAPRLVQELAHTTDAATGAVAGWLYATYALMQFLFAALLGVLSDRFGRRPVLLVALFGSGLDYIAAAFAPTLLILFITRAINGATGASVTVANAYVADITPGEKRGAAFGMTMAAFGMGFVLGPLIGGLIGDPSHHIPFLGLGNIRYPFYAAGALTLLNWLYGLLVLPESLPRSLRGPIRWKRSNPLGAFKGLGRYPLVAELGVSLFFLSAAQFMLHTTWLLYTETRYLWTARTVGLSLFTVGVATTIVQAGFAGRIIKKIGEKRAIVIGGMISVLAFAGYGTVPQGWMIFVIISFASFAGIAQPAMQSLITRTVRADEQGATQGAIAALTSIAAVIAPPVGGKVFEYFTARPDLKLPGATFYLSSLLAAVAVVVAWWAVRKVRVGEPAAVGM